MSYCNECTNHDECDSGCVKGAALRSVDLAEEIRGLRSDAFHAGTWNACCDMFSKAGAKAATTVYDIQRELEYWQTIALYLADCHAATAEYDGSLSKVSVARKERYASICEKAALAMKPWGYGPPYGNSRSPDTVAKRCREVAEKLRTEKP